MLVVRLPVLRLAVQEEQLGTGHAVMTALPELPDKTQDALILCGDTPLIRPRTLHTLLDQLFELILVDKQWIA